VRWVVDLFGQVREVPVLQVDYHPDLQILLTVVLHWVVPIILLWVWSIGQGWL